VVCPASHKNILSRGTQGSQLESHPCRVRDSHPLRSTLPGRSTRDAFCNSIADLLSARRALQPPHRIGSQTTQRCRFGLLPFRSPLLRESFPFLGVLRCFSSPGCPRLAYVFSQRYPGFAWVGSPIRVSLDISPAHGLPRAFRSVPRPSSASSA
jgi:hypothetical protein